MDINEIGLHLSNQWMKSGIVQGDLVLVHSSAKPLMIKIQEEFELKITPLEIFQSLQLAVGSSGTLIFPLFNFTAWPQNKKFDIRSTPSEMGGLSELSRNHPDSIRTGHPIYSFSIIGAKSDLFKNIDNVSGYGQDSVFALLKNFNGKIAIIGLPDQTSMTSYHYVEEANNVHYRYFKNFIGTYIDAQGNELEKTYKLFVRNLDIGVQTDVNRMMDRLWEKGLFKGDKPDENYFMRTISMLDLYNETESVIKNNEAINFLYSLEK